MPLGLSFSAPRSPLELFGELAPTMDIVPDTDLDVDLAIGLRFYFGSVGGFACGADTRGYNPWHVLRGHHPRCR